MKKLLLVLLFTSNLFAQNPTLTFANKESNVGYGGSLLVTKSVKDSNGNVYLIGNFGVIADFNPSPTETNLTAINSQDGDMFIAKYNSNGDFLWVKGIGGTGYVNCSAVVIGGNFIYIVGKYTNTIDFDPSTSNSNLTSANGSFEAAFIAKYDLNGNHIISKSIDGETELKFTSISFSNNQLLVSGNFSGAVDFDPSTNALNLSSNGGTDVFIAKYSTLFIPQWAYTIGGVNNDTCFSSTVSSSGELIITGNYTNTVDFDPSSASNILINSSTANNTFIAKYSTSGVLIWAKDIQAKMSGSQSSNPIIVCDASNNLIVAGVFNVTSDFDPSTASASLTASGSFVAKYDTNGNYIWAKKLASTTNKGVIYDSATTNVTVFGTFTSSTTSDFDPGTAVYNLDTTTGTNYFASYDTNGNFVYAKNIQPTITNIINIDFEGIYLTGNFSGSADFDPSTGVLTQYSLLTNGFIGRYDTTGAFVYVKAIGGNKPANNVTNFISTDGSGNIYRVGSLSATTDLDPSPSPFNVSSLSSPGIFISKYTSNGNFILGKAIVSTTGSSIGVSVMNTDTNGDTFIVGNFIGTIDFDPSANTSNMASNSATVSDLFIAKYDSNGNYVWSKQITGNIGARRKLVFDNSGNFYFTGTFRGINPIDVDPSTNVFNLPPQNNISSSTYIIKFNSQGDFIWAKSILAQSDTGSEFVSVTQFDIKNNSLYMTGRMLGGADFNPSPSETNILTTIITFSNETFFAKYDLDGNYQMAFKFDNDPNGVINKGSSFAIDDNGDIYLLAVFYYTVDFDPSPTTVFNLTALPLDDATLNLAILKYTENGSFVWAKQVRAIDVNSFLPFTSIQGNEWLSSTYIKNNELVVASSILGNYDFDPSSNDTVISSTVNADGNFNTSFFLAKYNMSSGELIAANKLEGDYIGEIYNTSLDNNQNLLLAGSFRGTVDFDFSAEVQNITSASPLNNDRFWAKYSTTTLGLEDNITSNNYRIYPNPTNGELFVSHPLYEDFNITITDITGKVLKTTTLINNESVDVASYPQGMYFIQIVSGNERNTYKFIKK